MPTIINQLISENQKLISVTQKDSAQDALSLMIEHDFSQLPVIDDDNKFQGMITSDSILRTVSYLKTIPENLKVSSAILKVRSYSIDDELSELLKGLLDASAIPIVDKQGKIQAIITSYDTAEYFRRRAENIILAEDIEAILRDLIEIPHRDKEGNLDENAISKLILAITPSSKDNKSKFKKAVLKYVSKTFDSTIQFNAEILDTVFTEYFDQPIDPKTIDELTLYEFIQIFKNLWPSYYSSIFGDLSWEYINHLLDDVRKTRNAIAHFREVTLQQHEKLKFCADFLIRHRPANEIQNLIPSEESSPSTEEKPTKDFSQENTDQLNDFNPTEEEAEANESRYSSLAIWLQTQKVDVVALSFNEIESIIENNLPPSARQHRSWWANDSVGHTQSIQWLDAGWRVSNVNIIDEQVSFSRIGDRQNKYINFFNEFESKLKSLNELSIKIQSHPQGRNWIPLIVNSNNDSSSHKQCIVFSFARKSRFRIEIYLNEKDKNVNKKIFDLLYEQKLEIENEFRAELSWERLDSKHGSRIAYYLDDSSINSDQEVLTDILEWAVEVLPRFYSALAKRYSAARLNVVNLSSAINDEGASS